MALNSSGPLSFGGSTVGQSINLELGVSATALASINSTEFRTLAGVLSGQISISNFYGKSSVTYFIGIFGTSGYSQNLNGVAVNSSGDFYITGFANIAGTSGTAETIKISPAGVLQFQKSYRKTNDGGPEFNAIVIASDGSYYVVGRINVASTGDDIAAVKFDSSGGLIWQKNLADVYSDIAYGVAVDSSDNVYAAGSSNSATTFNRMTLDKWNSSGTLQYQKEFGANSSTRYHFAQAVAVSGNNVYIAGYGNGFSRSGEAVLLNYNQSTNSMTWQQTLGASGTTEVFYAVVLDSSGNIYVAGTAFDGVSSIVAKYDSSGNLQWQRKLGTTSTTNYGIALDSSNNVYAVGDAAGSPQVLQLVKYNSSGTIQWQRKISQTSTMSGRSIAVSGNIMYIGGRTQATSGGQYFFIKLPNEGSLTGTYSVGGFSYTYAASTLTEADAGLINDTASYTIFSGALANQTQTYDNVTTSIANSITVIPA